LVIRALLVNFALVPLVALVLLFVLGLRGPLAIGLILLACSAGAPFLPKYVQVARGDIAFAVGLMTLLMIVTIVFLPIALPLLLPGVQVAPLDIARSLVLEMLIPLALGLFVKARYADAAAALQPVMAQTSTVALGIVIALFPVLGLNTLLGAIGSGAVLAALLLIVVSFALGYLLGGPGHASQVVLGFGTAQRNVAAALLVAASNFTNPDVLVMIIIGSTLQLVLLLVTAGELGRHHEPHSSLQ
jgi:BASS family bile acid:Na+ symporter